MGHPEISGGIEGTVDNTWHRVVNLILIIYSFTFTSAFYAVNVNINRRSIGCRLNTLHRAISLHGFLIYSVSQAAGRIFICPSVLPSMY